MTAPANFPKDELEILRHFFGQRAVPDGARIIRLAISSHEALKSELEAANKHVEILHAMQEEYGRERAALQARAEEAERKGMRPLKGDLYLKMGDHEGMVTMLLEREKVTPRHRAIMKQIMDLAMTLLDKPESRDEGDVNG